MWNGDSLGTEGSLLLCALAGGSEPWPALTSEETLVIDERAGLTIDQVVDEKLALALRTSQVAQEVGDKIAKRLPSTTQVQRVRTDGNAQMLQANDAGTNSRRTVPVKSHSLVGFSKRDVRVSGTLSADDMSKMHLSRGR
jgi:hypothetical protein